MKTFFKGKTPIFTKKSHCSLLSSSRDYLIFALAIGSLLFGTYNSSQSFAQQPGTTATTPVIAEGSLLDTIIVKLLAEVGPIVAAVVTIGIQYLRKKGVEISADAEETFKQSASSIVQKQSKWIYEQMRDNPDYAGELGKGRIPKDLGQKAKENVIGDLSTLLEDDKFTGSTKEVLRKNLPGLVERMVTENKRKMSEICGELLDKLVPLAVDSALLNLKSKEEVREKAQEITIQAVNAVAEVFDKEEILYSRDVIDMMVKAEIYRKAGLPETIAAVTAKSIQGIGDGPTR